MLAFPWRIHNEHTDFVADDGAQDKMPAADGGKPPPPKAQSAPELRRWTITVAALVALLFSLLLLVGDALAGVLTNLGGSPPSAGRWLGASAAGHGALALTSLVLLVLGLANPARRRAAVIAAWAIIPVGVGWFFLCGQLAAG